MQKRAKLFLALANNLKFHRTNYMFRCRPLLINSQLTLNVSKKPITLFTGAFVVYAATSQPKPPDPVTQKEVAQLTKAADDLFKENKFQEALDILRPYKDSGVEDILWRISRDAYNLSKSRDVSKEQRSALIEESYATAKLCLELNENSALAHKWVSISLDASSGLQGFKSRCSTLESVKNHMLRSIELDPSDATVIYMLGMWYYSIADLAWYQRSIVQAVVGKLPSATFEEALMYFKKAEETSPNFYSLNLLMLGKSHLKIGDKETAIAYLQRASSYPKFTVEDHQAHQEASELLKKLQAK